MAEERAAPRRRAERREPAPGRRLVIGIGNRDRGDDGVGRVIARRLRGRLPGGVEIREHDGEATGLLEWLAGADIAIIADAAISGAAPGAIRRLDCRAAELPREFAEASTHGLGLAEAIALARALGDLPRVCIVYVVEIAAIAQGRDPSPEVARAVDDVAARIIGELARHDAISAPVQAVRHA